MPIGSILLEGEDLGMTFEDLPHKFEEILQLSTRPDVGT